MTSVEPLLHELLAFEQEKLRKLSQEILGFTITDDDLLQPNDFPALELNPHFRYQEGIVSGLLTFAAAWRVSSSE